MVEVVLWNHLERFLWGVAFTIGFISGLLYLKKGLERNEVSEKIFMYGMVGFIFGINISVISLYLKDIFIPGNYQNNIFYGDYGKASITFIFFSKLAIVSMHLGMLLFIFAFEINFKRSKYVLTIIN